jgi:hypothetical protein
MFLQYENQLISTCYQLLILLTIHKETNVVNVSKAGILQKNYDQETFGLNTKFHPHPSTD